MKLTNISIPEGITSIEVGTFEYAGLNHVVLPSTLRAIKNDAFKMCQLESLELPNNLTSIGDYAFQEAFKDTIPTLYIPDGVLELENRAFAPFLLIIEKIKTVRLPKSCTKIGSYAVAPIDNLIVNWETPLTTKCTFYDDVYEHCTLWVPKGTVDKYKNAEYWKKFEKIKEFTDERDVIEGKMNNVPVTNIEIKPSSVSMSVGATQQLAATITPSNATDKSVTWKSSNTTVAKVSTTGLVTAVSEGSATITCTANDGSGVKATCSITVKKKEEQKVLVSKITLTASSASLTVGSTKQLTATISPNNATDKSVTWKSSNTTVAKVSTTGLVTAVSEGSATITCTANDGSGVKATCSVGVAKETPSSTATVTTSSDGYATFYDSKTSYILPNGLYAQVVTGCANKKLTYKTIAAGSASGIIPKGTAVMLVADNKLEDIVEHDGFAVFILNESSETSITLYAWGDAEAFGGWPGAQPTGTQTIRGVEYIYFDAGKANTGLDLNLIPNNNGGVQWDIANVTLDHDVYVRIADGGVYEVLDTPFPTIEHDGFVVYVDDQTGWDDLTLYMWGDTNDLNGGWPGMSVTGEVTLSGVKLKYFDMGATNTGLNENLIFHNGGNGAQLADFNFTIDRDIYLRLTESGVEEFELMPTNKHDDFVVYIDNARTFTLTPTEKSASYSGMNYLHGSDIATTTSATGSNYFYKLTYGPSIDSPFGWWWGAMNGAAFRIEGHKAWLALPQTMSRSLSFSAEGEATDIDEWQNDIEPTAIYDLQGRRVNEAKGQGLYIQNGKKRIVK